MLKNKYIILLIVLIIILFLIPFEYPVSISSKGKLFPQKTWLLTKGEDGRLLTMLKDNSTGINQNFTITQFQRGDAVQFKMNTSLLQAGVIAEGDTIGYIISNEIEKDIQKLKGELAEAKAQLNVSSSSEKSSVIEEEKNKLSFAEKELEEQTKLFDRKKLLYEKDLISKQEFEADEAKYELAKINIDIAKQRLRTVQSGAKSEEINLAKAQISALENEIAVLQKRYESNNIISPISGFVNYTYSADTLLTVDDNNRSIVLIPVKWENVEELKLNQQVSISSKFVDEVISGKIINISNNVETSNSSQYLLTTVLTDTTATQLKPGLYVDCEIECGETTLLESTSKFLSTLFVY